MRGLGFDFNNLFSFNVGKENGITEGQLDSIMPLALKGFRHLLKISKDVRNRRRLGLEWMALPYQGKDTLLEIKRLGQDIAANFSEVIFLGIGGSYLGLKAAQDALGYPYYNEFERVRNGRPRIYFEGNNLDPNTLSVLLSQLDCRSTCVVVISKSGKTLETIATFSVVDDWLKKGLGPSYGRHIVVITDPEVGILRQRLKSLAQGDPLSFRSLPLLQGVGGRFSELNMGLLHLAILGVDIEEVIAGARQMAQRCLSSNFFKNPALMYAAIMDFLYRKKNKHISIFMPFSETLKSTADWYVQLVAESLGKKYTRKIKTEKGGLEVWLPDTDRVLNVGITPIAARGTNDLHSIHQNNVEGENNKVVTFVRVEGFARDITLPEDNEFYPGVKFSQLLNLAQEAAAWSLAKEGRPNCCIKLPQLSPFYWGELIFFLEMAVAYLGEFLNINAFDQPGVESYKEYMRCKLNPKTQEQVVLDKKLLFKARYIL